MTMKKRRFIEAIVFLVLVTGVLAVLTKITTNSGDYRNFQWIRGFYEEREDSLDAVYIGLLVCAGGVGKLWHHGLPVRQ